MSLAKVTADVQMKLFGTIPSQYDKCQRLSLVELRVKTERPQRTCTSWAKAQEEIVSRIKGEGSGSSHRFEQHVPSASRGGHGQKQEPSRRTQP